MNTTKTRSTAKAISSGPLEITIKANIRTMREMAMERCTGLMGLATKVCGSEGISMARA